MYNLNIFTSNRMEILVEQLARITREPLPSTVAPEVVVVQSKGMERWVCMELARHNGICANCVFPFPNAFLKEFAQKMNPDLPDESFFDPVNMTFIIMKILPNCTQLSGFEKIRGYLADDTNHVKLFQISRKIAELFDQYIVFRPEMIFQWERGKGDHWQAHLWRKFSSGKEKLHRAWLRKDLIQRIQEDPLKIENLPSRISIFGISYLPHFYLEVFMEISRLTQVNLFLMNPCEEYWADIVSDRDIKKRHGKYSLYKNAAEALHLETGNRLLASMGMLGRNFFSMISGLECRIYEQFEDQRSQTMLSKIQSDILHLKDRQGTDHSNLDSSIQIHSCHSPMREIEVLHDNLLDMFEKDPDLLPKDIVVMTPDIGSYAPFIQAVFDSQTDETLRIPFTIADQNVKKESRIIEGFMSILDLKNSRLGATHVMKLLESPGVKEKFGLTESDIEIAEHWIKETNIRWGLDAEHRRKLGLPDLQENTWKAGIERLLLGYAMPGHDREMFSGILPYDHIEGGEVKILGRFLEFLDRVFACVDFLEQSRTLGDWNSKLVEIIEQFFATDEETERDIQTLRGILDRLSKAEELSGFENLIEIDVIKSYLNHLLEYEHFGTGFILSGVTFCAMLPMRGIPFKVIGLVGMGSDAFPRESKKLGFDLMAKNPKIGDRSRRNDDKYLFLEALISARDKFYISYTGQSIQDNTRIPPSVLVSELIDYIKEGFGITDEQLVTVHKLQAFSPEYFKNDTRLFSYSQENFSARRRADAGKVLPSFISDKLTGPTQEWKSLEIGDLCAFFSNPAKFLLERRLGIYLYEMTTSADDRENFSLSHLEKYQMGQDLVKNRLSGSDITELLPFKKASGHLPHGNVGNLVYNELSLDADFFAKKIENHTKGKQLTHIDVEHDIAGFKLVGRMDGLQKNGLTQIQYAKTKLKYILNTWIYHLIRCDLVELNHPVESYLLCKDATWKFVAVSNSREVLQSLLELYWNGMSEALHFFPESSFEYAQRLLLKRQTKETALKSAKKKWVGNAFIRGESEDPYYERCFGKTDPLDTSFQDMAIQVFSPLLAHRTKIVL